MSSFTRRIQRGLSPSLPVHATLNEEGKRTGWHSNPPRRNFYMGRGSRLGVTRDV